LFTKLAMFGAGYVLGTRAGREKYDDMVSSVREIVQGEEIAAMVGFVRGTIWILQQRGRLSIGRRAP
jgi:hypothetical protein